jgi:photosystem II stability/assembly factor-like uncharacterized protein
MKSMLIAAMAASWLAIAPAAQAQQTQAPQATGPAWVKQTTVPFRGKQDDIVFATPLIGWYGNGQGLLYHTTDGGQTWTEIWKKPGTFVRALGFVDEKIGFLGNVGTDYFPGVTDEHPLYKTTDGGVTWTPVTAINGPTVKGICAIDVLKVAYINHGVLDYKTTIRAAGRVGGPAFLMESTDLGATWTSRDLSAQTTMILDVKFINATTGFIAGATTADVETSHALVLRTDDGGKTWTKVYESQRPFELTWKLAFPSDTVGYVTVQNYDPAETNTARYVAKTTDGGKTWRELPLAQDHALREFGIGFVDDNHGWVGDTKVGMQTSDGGATWQPANLGQYVNKIRILKLDKAFTAVAIGNGVHRLDAPLPKRSQPVAQGH